MFIACYPHVMLNNNKDVKVNIPKFPAAFVGTGDLFTALR